MMAQEEEGAGSNEDEAVFDPVDFQTRFPDSALRIQLIEIFHEDSAKLLDEARAALSEGDGEALAIAAHSLKGMVGNYSTGKAWEAAARLDGIARDWESSGLDDADPALADCEREIGRLGKALSDYRERMS